MKVKIGDIDAEAEKLIPPAEKDNSGVGVNYATAYLKGIGETLEDGRKVAVKRKGLRVTLTIGDNKGEALMSKYHHGPDVKNILHQALTEAAQEAGAALSVEDDAIFLDV